ncbi:MAG: hypothetical protein J6R71_00495 [Bacteroidales bacterium]|nr:hypothetical protein [Bacteroidales bacterium]
MKKKFGKLIMAVSVICAVGMFFSSCNDYVADVNAELKGQIADLNAGLTQDLTSLESALQAAITECKTQCDAERAKLDQAIKANASNITDLLNRVATLETKVATLETALGTLQTAVSKNTTDIADLLTKYQAQATALTALEQKVNGMNTKLTATIAEATAAMVLATANATKISNLEAEIAKIKSCSCDLTDLEKKVADNKASIDSLAGVTSAIETQVENIYDSLEVHAEKIENLEAADKLLQAQIDSLADEVTLLKDAVEELSGRLDIVENRLNKRISSVVVNGAYNPVVGYFNLPTGMRSNILAAYYNVISSPANELKFPTVRTSNYVDPTAAFTDAEAAFLGFAETSYGAKNDILVGTEGNAGTLYLTINPNDVDTTGIKLALKNSLGEESAVVLGPLVKSEKKLNFGYTRAANNGFYEVAATLDPANIEKAQIRVEVEDLKNVLSDFKSIGNGVNLSNAIGTLYNAVNDIADAYAVEATYIDSLGEHQVYSDYALAAVAVKPLSYNSLADLNVESFPGIDRVSSLMNRVFDRIGTISIPDLGLDNLSGKLDSISFAGVIGDSIRFNVAFTENITKNIPFHQVIEVPVPLKDVNLSIPVPSQTVTTTDVLGNPISIDIPGTTITHTIPASSLMSGTPTVTIDTTFTISIDIDINRTIAIPSEEVLGNLGGTLDNVDDLLKDVNAMLKDFTGKIEDVENKVNDALVKVENKLNEYLDKINNKLCSLLNSINSKLQPTMLVSTTDGFAQLSSIKAAPSQINATSAVLVPTSYTGEVLAPAMKKYVAVTAAFDRHGNSVESVARAANTGDLNTVLDGQTRAISFNGQSGYTYEITYSAVDFSGYISNTKYYVQVK